MEFPKSKQHPKNFSLPRIHQMERTTHRKLRLHCWMFAFCLLTIFLLGKHVWRIKILRSPWCWRKGPQGDKGRGGKSWNDLNEWDLLPFRPPLAVFAISRRVESCWSSSYEKIMTFTCEFSRKASERCHFASANPLPKEFQSFLRSETREGWRTLKRESLKWVHDMLISLMNFKFVCVILRT